MTIAWRRLTIALNRIVLDGETAPLAEPLRAGDFAADWFTFWLAANPGQPAVFDLERRVGKPLLRRSASRDARRGRQSPRFPQYATVSSLRGLSSARSTFRASKRLFTRSTPPTPASRSCPEGG
jgi:hypothetical protein